jgi:hypothetical protein
MTTLTKHALARVRQRGLRERDVDFILRFGTDTGDGVILSARDAQQVIAEAKRYIGLAERLKNKMVVDDGNVIITVLHTDRRQQHRLLHE